MDLQSQFSRRERQIMDIVAARGEAPAAYALATSLLGFAGPWKARSFDDT